LEQIVQTIAYPRTLLTFTLSLVSCKGNSELNLLPACLNACICLLNRAGINQKAAPFAALTLQFRGQSEVRATDFLDDGESTMVELTTDDQCNILAMQTVHGTNAMSYLLKPDV
jgi:hypothetical protein